MELITTITDIPALSVKAENMPEKTTEDMIKGMNAAFENTTGQTLAEISCNLIASGVKVAKISKRLKIPAASLLKYLKGFPDLLEAAQLARSNDLIEEAVRVIKGTDDENVYVDRAISTIYLAAAKLKQPQKQEVNHNVAVGGGIQFIQAKNCDEVIDITPLPESHTS